MKKVKTLFATLMVFTMVLGLTACAGTNANGTADKQENETQNTSEETATSVRRLAVKIFPWKAIRLFILAFQSGGEKSRVSWIPSWKNTALKAAL